MITFLVWKIWSRSTRSYGRQAVRQNSAKFNFFKIIYWIKYLRFCCLTKVQWYYRRTNRFVNFLHKAYSKVDFGCAKISDTIFLGQSLLLSTMIIWRNRHFLHVAKNQENDCLCFKLHFTELKDYKGRSKRFFELILAFQGGFWHVLY